MSEYTRHGPTVGPSRKRKDRDGVSEAPVATKAEPGPAPAGNRLLAGYLAHEFLTRGTLLGQRPDPARPEPERGADPVRAAGGPDQTRAYADVAYLLKSDGAHIPGIVNPSQLARWLQLG